MVFKKYVKHNRRCVSRIQNYFCAEVSLLSPAAKFCNNRLHHIPFQWRERKTNFTLSCHPIVIWCLSAVLLKKRLLKRFLVFPVFPSKSAPPIPRSKEKPSNILKPPAMRKNWQQKSRQVFSPRFQGNREPHFKTIITTPTMKTTTTEETITTTKTTRTIPMTSKNADSL